ncbi:DMT family transporter [Blastococcus xanthinilyticus]|uniref:EamA-like transporter family protein n=1 Tax=Blastococcus xanthinilyticus TaxID=1564164 RepID=A0A5S5CQP5_9ACTN|nr:DMT family transporter [Blastococcus xanthinilyticus]TYP84655.1 EamA-like transporter family protein [Blastococcus xanthinilyticus]
MAVVLALASAVVYGASDFLGGLASRRASVFGVVALSQLAGLVALLVLLPWLGGPVTATDLWAGGAAGLAGAAGLLVFFRALAGGVMSVVAPVTAVTAAAVPVLVGTLDGERIGPWAGIGIGLALVAVVLVSAEGGLSALRGARPASLAPALVAGAAFGLFFVLLDRTSAEAGLTPLVAARIASVTLVGAVALATGAPLRAGRAALPLVVVSGVGDMTANALFLLATQVGGPLAITGVLASLYPVTTVLLAQLVLRERLVPAQLAGLATAAAAVVLITMPA